MDAWWKRCERQQLPKKLVCHEVQYFVMYQSLVCNLDQATAYRILRGPVKLIQRVKIAHSFLQSLSNLFHFIILSLPM